MEHADLRLQIPPEEWLGGKLPKPRVAQALAAPLRERPGLWQAVADREKAINRLVETHVRLAQPFARRAMRRNCEFGDLMNEAVLILRRAAERFDPASGNRFSSYARVALERELRRKSPSHIGVTRHTRSQISEVSRLERALVQERGCPVTADDVYEQLACPEATRIEIENVRRLLAANRLAHADERATALALAEADLPEPCHEAAKTETGQQLRVAFSKLSWMEKRVVVGHCICGQSFRAMAKRYKKSPHTLRGVYKGALEQLVRRLDPNRCSHKPR